MLEFIIVFTVFMFVFVAIVDYYGAFVQYDRLRTIKNYYIDRVKVEGQLTADSLQELMDDLENNGFEAKHVAVLDHNDAVVNYSFDNAVVRNTLNPQQSVLKLEIEVYPNQEPFFSGRLLGASEEGEFFMKTGGNTISELPKKKID